MDLIINTESLIRFSFEREGEWELHPGEYSVEIPWLFTATVSASILLRISGSEALLETENLTTQQEAYLAAAFFSILSGTEGINEGDLAIKYGESSALLLPRSREHLEAAARIGWLKPIQIVRGLTARRSLWREEGTSVAEIAKFAADNTICLIEACYEFPEIQVLDLSERPAIEQAVKVALISWNLR